jgi:hypothetical protein
VQNAEGLQELIHCPTGAQDMSQNCSGSSGKAENTGGADLKAIIRTVWWEAISQ